MDVGTIVEYESPDGDVWTLITPERGRSRSQRVVLAPEGLEGLSGQVEETEVESVTGYGVRGDGWKIPVLDSTVSYTLRAPMGELEQTARAWRRAWPSWEPGRLIVRSAFGEDFWCPVSVPAFPEFPNGLHRRTTLQESVTFRNKKGHWFGSTELFTGPVTVRVGGDRPLSPSLRLRWDGQATSVIFPSGLRVNLPAIGVERIINLDRGMSGQMTRPDGTVDSGGWSSLQGIVHGVSLRPGEETTWVLGAGIALEVTPRYLSPWR